MVGFNNYLNVEILEINSFIFYIMSAVSDIAHAMKWIKREIEAFGGDPNRFTLMGHSGGGAIVKLVVF